MDSASVTVPWAAPEPPFQRHLPRATVWLPHWIPIYQSLALHSDQFGRAREEEEEEEEEGGGGRRKEERSLVYSRLSQ